MTNSKKNIVSQEDMRRLAGLIARMPDASPPTGITDAVMRRIQPKKIPWHKKWVRRFLITWTELPIRAAVATATLVLVVGGFAFLRGFHTGRDLPVSGVAMTEDGHIAITFALDWPEARKVDLIGSFNHWNPKGYQMHRDTPQSPWELVLTLGQGKYQYAFVIDDQRVVPDPNALWRVDDGFGNFNSALIVENGKQNANES